MIVMMIGVTIALIVMFVLTIVIPLLIPIDVRLGLDHDHDRRIVIGTTTEDTRRGDMKREGMKIGERREDTRHSTTNRSRCTAAPLPQAFSQA
jgi:hypothetical protein